MVGFALMVGGLWEIKEFISNNMYAGIRFNPFDTIMDMVYDTLGGIISFIYLTYFKNYD